MTSREDLVLPGWVAVLAEEQQGRLSQVFTSRMDLGWTQACPESVNPLQLEVLLCIFSPYASVSKMR